MSLCEACTDIAIYLRKYHDAGLDTLERHPDNCGCPCQHVEPKQWEKQFSVPRPGHE